MGVTGSCWINEDKERKHSNMEKLDAKCSQLNEQYEFEREQKTQSLTKIKECREKYDELMNSHMLLSEKYENEIVATSANISDEYKQFQDASHAHNCNDIDYKQQINELNKQISISNEKHNQSTQEIDKLNEEIKSLQKRRTVSFADTVPIPVNDKMIMSSLKLQVANLEKKLREYELQLEGDSEKKEAASTSTPPLNMLTTGTEFSNIVLQRYQTNLYEEDSVVTEPEPEPEETDNSHHHRHKTIEIFGDSDSEESSLEEHEKEEIARRQTEIKRKSRIEQDFDGMTKQLLLLQNIEAEVQEIEVENNLFRDDSREWEKKEVKKLKKEMGQQMVHLMKEAMSSDNVDVDVSTLQTNTDLPK